MRLIVFGLISRKSSTDNVRSSSRGLTHLQSSVRIHDTNEPEILLEQLEDTKYKN